VLSYNKDRECIMTEQPLTIGIFFFSGTGNTKAVAEMLATSFKEHGCTVDTVAIDEILKNNKNVEIEKYDIVGFGYPVHALNAPRIFFEFLRQLPEGNQKKTFVFKSSGDPYMNGGSTLLVRKALQKKGYNVVYERLFVMPANVLVRYKDQLIKQLYNTAIQRAHTMIYEILSGISKLQNNSYFSTWATAVFSSMESYGARFFGKHLRVSSSCTLCGICIDKCPTNNIVKQNGRVTFDSKCVLCMRCIYGCPTKAISPQYLKFFVIKNWYDLQKIVKDPSINDTYVTTTTRGYFRHYYPYFSKPEP
jgi:ferredoxin/flavodoxin